jgi:ADP-heptose:LPS heptosyltransferase
VTELLGLLDHAGAFIGNDSGPGHLAVFCGVPTLTIFGPQLPEWFAPLHPDTVCLDGKPCPYKPCSDYCRFREPHCLTRVTEEEVWEGFERFLHRQRDVESRRVRKVKLDQALAVALTPLEAGTERG